MTKKIRIRPDGKHSDHRLIKFADKLSTATSNISIKAKLIGSFIVPIVLIIVLGIVSYTKASDGIQSSYELSTTQSINMSGSYLGMGIENIEALSLQYINDDSLKQYLTGFYKDDIAQNSSILKNYRKVFSTKSSTDKFISNITILGNNGYSIAQKEFDDNVLNDFYNTELGKNIQKNPTKAFWIGSDEFLDEKLGKDYALRYVRSVTGTDAIIVIDYDIKMVKQILTDLQLDQLGEIGFVTSDVEIFSDKEKNEKSVFTNQEFYKKAVSSDQTSSSQYVKANGKKNLFINAKVGESGAMICVLLPKDVILSKTDGIKNATIITVIFSCIVAIFIGSMISIDIESAIRYLNTGLGRAAKGDLTVQFDSNRKDEFHNLIAQMQNTFSNMKELVQKVQRLSIEVSGSSENVTKTSEAFLKSSKSISHAMSEIEEGINQQAKDAEQCLVQMDKLSNKIFVVSESTKEIRKITGDTYKSIEEGTMVTRDLNEQTKATMSIASEIIKEIEELATKSTSVGKIINVINEIASQTNLLSLNASIEAARAGEHGRGFSVVAEEVRKLSEQSSTSVKEIIKIIAGIEEDTIRVTTTAKKVESVMQKQELAVENTTNSYQKINQNVEKLVEDLNDISANVDNMEEARVSTLQAIENISSVLEEIAASSEAVNEIANELVDTVGSLNEAAGSLNENSGHLVNAAEIFSV